MLNTLLALPAHPCEQTLSLLFNAWRNSQSVFLYSPQLPEPVVQKWIDELKEPSNIDLFLLTSGSSGSPKLAAFRREALFESAEIVSQALDAQSGDRWLLSIPLSHIGGLAVALRAHCSGGSLLFADKKRSQAERILSARVQFASLVPTQLYRLLKEDWSQPIHTHLLIGGAPLSQTLYQQTIQRNLSLSLTYALTEMCSTVLLTSHPFWDDDLLPYLGFPLPGREVHLSNEYELMVRGASLFEGYGISPQKPNWFPTGDLALFHEQHGIKICGRKDFQFLSGGENIQPEEIEAALLSLPEIEKAVVVPLHDEEFGARPAAYLQTSLPFQEIPIALSSLLPKLKIPIEFRPLEPSESLKPNRKKLTELINNKLLV